MAAATDGRPPSAIHTRGGERQSRLVFGSCRVGAPAAAAVHACRRPRIRQGLGVDALWAYSRRLQDGASADGPTRCCCSATRCTPTRCRRRPPRSSASRRDIDEPPGEEIADFEEYTRLYRESWSDPDIRWLLSTVPSTMIFDDHDVSDDWNISQSWVDGDALAALVGRAHHGRVHVVLALPAPRQPLAARARGGDDVRSRCSRTRMPARACESSRAGAIESRRRAAGRTTATSAARVLLVIDSRAARVLADGQREMIDDGRVGLDRRARPRLVRPLIIASTLPVFMPHGIHHLEAWNEAVCAGRWGAAAARLGRARPARRRPRALGGLSRLVRAARRPAARHQHGSGRRAAGHDHPARRRRAHGVYRRGRARGEAGREPRLPDRLLAVPQSASAPFARRVVKATGSRTRRRCVLRACASVRRAAVLGQLEVSRRLGRSRTRSGSSSSTRKRRRSRSTGRCHPDHSNSSTRASCRLDPAPRAGEAERRECDRRRSRRRRTRRPASSRTDGS